MGKVPDATDGRAAQDVAAITDYPAHPEMSGNPRK
jgi:hypothetical protein